MSYDCDVLQRLIYLAYMILSYLRSISLGHVVVKTTRRYIFLISSNTGAFSNQFHCIQQTLLFRLVRLNTICSFHSNMSITQKRLGGKCMFRLISYCPCVHRHFNWPRIFRAQICVLMCAFHLASIVILTTALLQMHSLFWSAIFHDRSATLAVTLPFSPILNNELISRKRNEIRKKISHS